MLLKIGEKTDLMVGQPEGCIFNVDGGGLFLAYNYNSPTPAEIEAFSAGAPFEIRFVRVNGVLFILAKAGNMPWIDAPYAIQLSPFARFPALEQNEGYALTLMLIDRKTSIVKGLRVIGLGHTFSEQLHAEIMSQAHEPLFASEYYAQVSAVYQRYSTKQLVQFSTQRYKLK